MGMRRKGREFALQALYLADITKGDAQKSLTLIVHGAAPEKAIQSFASQLVEGADLHREELDGFIQKYAKNWDVDRMAALDRNILRMGAYELIYETDTPVSVIIDEAVELAKIFSTEESSKFVNGILDRIKNERKKNQ